jgi:hypothetical protein
MADKIAIPEASVAPRTLVYQKPQKYNKLEYRINTTKLRMKFYLRAMEMFSKPRDTVISTFAGGKVVCIGVVGLSLTNSCLSMYDR